MTSRARLPTRTPLHPPTTRPPGLGEVLDIYIFLSAIPYRSPPPQPKAFPMTPRNSPVLQRLYKLDASSPDFQDQLYDLLREHEFQECVPALQGDDLMQLVDYLDEVRLRVALPTLRSSRHRLSIVSILPVWLPKSHCMNSEPYAAIARYSQHGTTFRLTSKSIPALPPPVIVICARGPSKVQRFT